MKGDDIAERLLDFAAEVLLVVGTLPKSTLLGSSLARGPLAERTTRRPREDARVETRLIPCFY